MGLLLLTPGSNPALAGNPPLVLAFYYAWYDQNTWDSGMPADLPAQPYASSDPAAIERHVSQAQASGIDGLIQSWYGPQETHNQTETNFRTLLDVAAQKGFYAAVDFETTGPFFTDKDSVVDALRHLLTVHAEHPGYLRYHGKPVIFFWRQGRFSVEEWTDIRAQVDPQRNSLWIAEGVDISYQTVFDGHHLYSVAWSPNVERTLDDWGFRVRRYEAQNGTDRLWVATAMPGYDDTRTNRTDAFAVYRQDGGYYRETWSAAIASQPDWIIITSFNEWIEGTMIEPSQSYGDLYLDLTRQLATEFKSGSDEPDSRNEIDEPDTSSQETEGVVQIEPYIQAEEAVRVRSGPGTSFARIGQLWPGETAPVLGKNDDGSWWQIEFAEADDGQGWVSAEFVTFVGDPDSVPVVGEVVRTPTPVQSPTPIVTQTSPPTRTPSPAPTHTPTQALQPTQMTPTPAPPSTPTPWPTLAPTPTLAAPVSPTAPSSPTVSPTVTSTPMLRVTPVAHRRPVGLLWLGGAALVVAIGLGILLLWTVFTKKKR